MPWNGSGVYTRTNGQYTGATVWQQDAAAGILILASRHDTNDQDMATALNVCLTKDGQNSPTANLPMGGYKHTGVLATSGSGSGTEYVSGATLVNGGVTFGGITGGSSDAYLASAGVAGSAYALGMRFTVEFNFTNTTTTPTINFNSLGAKTIKVNSGALAAGEGVAGQIGELEYDGSAFVLLNPPAARLNAANTYGTSAGTQDFNANIVAKAKLKDYREVYNSFNGSATATLDLSTGNQFKMTLTANCTLSVTNPPSTGISGGGTLFLTQGGSGSYTVTWPSSFKWPSSTAATLTTTVGATDLIVFQTNDGGSSYAVIAAGQNFLSLN